MVRSLSSGGHFQIVLDCAKWKYWRLIDMLWLRATDAHVAIPFYSPRKLKDVARDEFRYRNTVILHTLFIGQIKDRMTLRVSYLAANVHLNSCCLKTFKYLLSLTCSECQFRDSFNTAKNIILTLGASGKSSIVQTISMKQDQMVLVI